MRILDYGSYIDITDNRGLITSVGKNMVTFVRENRDQVWVDYLDSDKKNNTIHIDLADYPELTTISELKSLLAKMIFPSVVSPEGPSSSAGNAGTLTGTGNIYSTAQRDFSAIPVVGTKNITITGCPFELTVINCISGTFKKIYSNGDIVRIPTTNLVVTSNVITLADADTAFSASDAVEVSLVGPDKPLVLSTPAHLNAYSSAQGNFSITVVEGTKNITITGCPFVVTWAHCANGLFKRCNSSGRVTVIPNYNISISGSIITLGALEGSFESGDVVEAVLYGPDKQNPTTAISTINAYSTSQGHFIATPTVGSRDITLTGCPFQLSWVNCINGKFLRKDSNGNIVQLPTNKIVITGSVITLGSMEPAFAAGDEVEVVLSGPDKAYDTNIDVQKIINLSRPSELETDILIDTTNIAAGTNYYPSSDGLVLIGKNPTVQVVFATGASNDLVTTLEITDEPDGITPAKWLQTYFPCLVAHDTANTAGLPVAGQTGIFSLTLQPSQTWKAKFDMTDFIGKRVRIKQVTSNGGTATNTVYISVKQQPWEG